MTTATTAVCFDPETARTLLRKGTAVVLLGNDGEALGQAAAALRTLGRLAILVGEPAVEADLRAATALAAEQFGAEPVIVPDLELARELDPLVK